MLAAALENQHIEINLCEGDADVVIVQTALKMSQNGYRTIVTQGYFSVNDHSCFARQTCSSIEATNGKSEKEDIFIHSFAAAAPKLREFILLVHGFSGYDSTSAIYVKGKKQLLKTFEANAPLIEHVRVFSY